MTATITVATSYTTSGDTTKTPMQTFLDATPPAREKIMRH